MTHPIHKRSALRLRRHLRLNDFRFPRRITVAVRAWFPLVGDARLVLLFPVRPGYWADGASGAKSGVFSQLLIDQTLQRVRNFNNMNTFQVHNN